jgi:hypothetical protein
MMFKKAKSKKSKLEDKLDTQENPAIIFQPLSNMKIIVWNGEEKDEYKTEPVRPQKA